MRPGQHRETARVVLVNAKNEIFLLLTEFDPEVKLPPRWLTPGGGIDEGETVIEAAVRELQEETGLEIDPNRLETFLGSFEGTWQWGDGVNHHSFVDHVYISNVPDFQLDKTKWTTDEHRDILEFRWWSLDELEASGEPVSPPGLVQAIRNQLSN